MYYRVVYLCRFSLCVCVCVCTFSFHLMWTNDYIMHLPPHNCQSLWLCGLIRKADFKFWKSFLYVTLRYVYMLFRFVCNSLSLLSSLNLVCCSKSHQQVQFFCVFERVRRRGAERKKTAMSHLLRFMLLHLTPGVLSDNEGSNGNNKPHVHSTTMTNRIATSFTPFIPFTFFLNVVN